DGVPRIVAGQHALDDDRTAPKFPDPTQVSPGHRGFCQRGGDIDQRHRTPARHNNVRKRGDATVHEETDEPPWTREYLRKIRDFLERSATDEFLHAVARVALANSGHRSVNGDDEGGESGDARPFDGGLCCPAATHQVELIENRAVGTCLYI